MFIIYLFKVFKESILFNVLVIIIVNYFEDVSVYILKSLELLL